MGEEARDYLPHGVTENDFLEKLEPEELENIQQNIVYSMIRRKTFDSAKVFKKWQVIIDATELDEGLQKKNDYYLSRFYNKGEKNEFTRYHRSVLEAIKQDCESKAFVRLAAKIKKKFPRLPIIITADGLYVTKNVLQICSDYKWDYIIRYKEGSASSIAKEYRALPEKETVGTGIWYQNKVMFNDLNVNLIYYRERRIIKGEEKETEIAWITSIEITKSNAEKIVRAGRHRWKIENQGFNRQKHWQGNIEYVCSFNERAQKNH